MDIYEQKIQRAHEAFYHWKNVPAPARGEFIRMFGIVLRERKEDIARCITRSMFKTIRESRGEVQEVIDMCDFAVGLSRQLYGLTMPSERWDHRLQELWLPLGVVGVITAFNFPCAVWGWNFCLAAVCGDTVIWKPSNKSKGVAEMMQAAWQETCMRLKSPTSNDVSIVLDDSLETGVLLSNDPHVALISATGSVRMGKQVAQAVSGRLGRLLLELGGNNSAIISEKADLDLAIKGCVFGAVGTTGQRCTTLRRAFVHSSMFDQFVQKMIAAYKTIKIGDPLDEEVLIGPLVDEAAFRAMQLSIDRAKVQGATGVFGGERVYPTGQDDRVYVNPCIITSETHLPIMEEETFAPILYVMPYDNVGVAIQLCNSVRQGLSSCIFTDSVMESEMFLRESYTGIVNINAGPSGAEIGGAFGGEKDTGGGRESGSDAWKAYMRRVTSTVNYSGQMPLAQGIKFD